MRRFWLFWDSVCTVYSESYVNNRKIGKVNRLCKRIEPFPALFWALAGRPGIPKPWYWYGTVRQGSLRFNLTEEALPPTPVLSSCTYSMLWMKPWFRGLKIRIDTPPIYHHCCFGGNVYRYKCVHYCLHGLYPEVEVFDIFNNEKKIVGFCKKVIYHITTFLKQ